MKKLNAIEEKNKRLLPKFRKKEMKIEDLKDLGWVD